MAEKQSIWNVLNAVLGGMAAIVTAGTGLYLALRQRFGTDFTGERSSPP